MNWGQSFMLVLTGLAALLNWIAAINNNRKLFVITKPLVMVLLIGFFVVSGGVIQEGLWFLFALVFSLAGDILLMLPPGWFISGLVAFFMAQVTYLIGFNHQLPSFKYILLVALVMLIPVGLVLIVLLKLRSEQRELRKLSLPIVCYVLLLAGMAGSAILTLLKPTWSFFYAILAAVGGILFMISDMTLAYDKFVRRLKHSQVFVMTTYHLAQFGLILGFLGMKGLL